MITKPLPRLLHLYSVVFLTLTFFVALLYRFNFYLLHPLAVGSDQSVYLAFAQMILKGAVPYLDIYDFNFPLIMYISLLPVAISRILPLAVPLPLVFDYFIYGLFALSAVLVVLIFRSVRSFESGRGGLVWALLGGMLWWQQSQLQDLGQREHIFVLLYLPYFVLRYFAMTSPAWRGPGRIALGAVCAILASVGMHLKPHFPLTVIVAELFLMLQCGGINIANLKRISGSLEIRLVLALTLVYVLHFAFYPAASLAIFFGQAVPIYVAGFSWFNSSLLSLFAGDPNFCFTTLTLVVALLLAIPLKERCGLIMPLLGFTLSSFALYVVFITAWTYRYLPVQAGAYLLIAVELWVLFGLMWRHLDALSRLALSIILPPLLFLSTICFASESVRQYWLDVARGDDFDVKQVGGSGINPALELSPIFYSILKNTDPGDAVLFIGTGVTPGYPAILQAGRVPGSRYLHGMHLPMLNLAVQEERGEKYVRWLSQACDNYGKDIARIKPTLIFIQEGEISEILKQHHFFERYLSQYKNLGPLGFDSLTVYKLGDGGSGRLAVSTVIDIIQGRADLQSVARKSNISVEKLGKIVLRTKAALGEAIKESPGGGELSARSELLQMQGELFEARRKLEELQNAKKIKP